MTFRGIPPARILRSILLTVLVVWPFLRGLTVSNDVPPTSPVGIFWAHTVTLVLVWIEIKRQRYRMFLLNLGIGRRSLLLFTLVVISVLELVLQATLRVWGGG